MTAWPYAVEREATKLNIVDRRMVKLAAERQHHVLLPGISQAMMPTPRIPPTCKPSEEPIDLGRCSRYEDLLTASRVLIATCRRRV